MHRFLLLLLLLFSMPLNAQDPALKDTFLQAKALWSTQGNREEATARFEKVVEALAPKGSTLSAEWQQVLCETYNWLAVLDDRSAATKPRVRARFEALLGLNPDFEVDAAITSQKLTALLNSLRADRFALLKLSLHPEGGLLQVDGRAVPVSAKKYLPFGTHRILYQKPGHAPSESTVELAPRETKSLDLKLTRLSSTLTLHVFPSGTEVLLDGVSLGRTKGSAGSDAQALAGKAGLRPEDLSEAFLVAELKTGDHMLEFRAPCHRPKRLSVGKEFTEPMADHLLEAVKLEPSKGILTITSPWEGGQLFLDGQSYGSLPQENLPVCAGTYDLLVGFPSGGYSARVEIQDGKALKIEARPRPRLAFLGLDGTEDFTGRTRILGLLAALGQKTDSVAFLPARTGEAPKDGLARLKSSRGAELYLLAAPVQEKVIHQVELTLSTLEGEEERFLVKPLEADPLGPLVQRLNALPALFEPGLGLTLVDAEGEAGPLVLSADPAALKAGITLGKPLLQVNGKAVSSAAAFRQALQEAKGDKAAVAQGAATLTLALQKEPLEIPLNSSRLAYPLVISHLRLQLLGARGEEAAHLRLNLALALMHFRKYDKALELLRDTRLSATRGVSQGTLDYITGLCFLRLGGVYVSEAGQAFRAAAKSQATLFGPDGPPVAPLAKAILEDLKL